MCARPCSVAVVVLCATALCDDTVRPLSKETLRRIALRAIFPGMQVSPDRSNRLSGFRPEKPQPAKPFFPDALSGDSAYKVLGEAMNEAEREASDVRTGKFSSARQVRFKLFRWPKENDAGLLAVLQYNFPNANPAMSCPSIGLLVHLAKHAQDWTVKEEYLLETVHHSSIQGVRLLDFTGHGADALVIESDTGGAGATLCGLHVFDLSGGHFDEVLDTQSRLQYMTDDWYTQVLDSTRRRGSRGQRFCFTKTTLFENGKAFRPPRITHPCYQRGDGVDVQDISRRNRMLAPPR